jgi:ribosome-associated translation inhibitor RaiA
MQIHVAGAASYVTAQVRAYAEYRVFSRLAPLVDPAATVLVVVTRSGDPVQSTVCAVSADLGEAGTVRARSRHAHPSGAIDAAAEKLAAAVAERMQARDPARIG